MAINFNSLTTPENYISYYSQNLKTDLEQNNLQINKLGFIFVAAL